MKVMFLDESGNHDLRRINPVYPLFVLGGVIVDRAYVRNTIAPQMHQFKLHHFGRSDVLLHTVEMGKGRGDYAFLANPVRRTEFYADLNALLQQWEYKVVTCVFDLPRFVAKHAKPADPYHEGLEILIDRFCDELGDDEDAGFICAEKRNPGLDRALIAAWERLMLDGGNMGHERSVEVDRKIVDLNLKDKHPAMAGLQLADLVVTPPGRFVLYQSRMLGGRVIGRELLEGLRDPAPARQTLDARRIGGQRRQRGLDGGHLLLQRGVDQPLHRAAQLLEDALGRVQLRRRRRLHDQGHPDGNYHPGAMTRGAVPDEGGDARRLPGRHHGGDSFLAHGGVPVPPQPPAYPVHSEGQVAPFVAQLHPLPR